MATTKWEYRRRSANLFNEMTIMREMGEEGWQLCAVWLFLLYFRRPVQERSD